MARRLPRLLALTALLGGGLWLRHVLRRRRRQRLIRKLLRAGQPSSPPRVIVTLTTLPSRIHGLGPTIQSLLGQTCVPDEIVIVVPPFSLREKRAYEIPASLCQWPRVRLLRCAQDWGPATKFIPVIQEELAAGRKDTLVMVVDDDVIYPRDSLELYLHYQRELPGTALSFRGEPIARNLSWSPDPPYFGADLDAPVPVAIITGAGSYLLQPGFFDQRLWDYSGAPEGAFYMDDVWISGWLDRRQVRKCVVPASRKPRPVIRQLGKTSLDQVPRGRRQLNEEVMAFFRDTWNVFYPA